MPPLFSEQYRSVAPPEKQDYLEPLKEAFINYLRALGIDETVINTIDQSMSLYLVDNP